MYSFAHQPRVETRIEAPLDVGGTGFGDLGQVVDRIRSGLVWVIASGIAALVAAILALGLIPPIYTSQTEILVDPVDLKVIENGVNPSNQLADSGVSIVESQVKVIASDSVLSRVVSRLNLQDDPEFAPAPPQPGSLSETVKRALGLAPSEGPANPELQAIEALRRKMTVRRPERTFVIEVVVKSRSGQKSALIANTIADTFFTEETAARAKAAGRASDALAARLATLRGTLLEAEKKAAAFREKHNLVKAQGLLLGDQRLSELNAQLSAAALRTAALAKQAEQARDMRGRIGTALPEMLQSPEMRALRQQLVDLLRAQSEIGKKFGPRHPAVTEQGAQVRELEAAIAHEKGRIIESTIKEYDRASTYEKTIRRDIDGLKRETERNNRDLIVLRDLERNVETQRTIYESFLKRSRETGEQERLDTTNMRIISAATPPLGRSWPPSPKVVLPVALLFGLGLGAALVAYGGILRSLLRRRA